MIKITQLFLATALFNSLASAASASLYEVCLSAETATPPLIKEAFYTVINRLTPGVNDKENPVIEDACPSEYVQRITNKRKNQPCITFNSEAINQLMVSAANPPLLKTRPPFATWVVFAYTDKKAVYHAHFIDKDHEPALFATLEKSMASKGFQLTYPRLTIPLNDKNIANELPYSKSAIEKLMTVVDTTNQGALLIYLQQDIRSADTYWEGCSVGFKGRTHAVFDLRGVHPSVVGQYCLEGVSRFLFNRFEKPPVQKQSVFVNIGNIRNEKAYKAVNDYLEHIPGVKHISVNSVTADAILYTLDLTIPVNLLDKRLARHYKALPYNPVTGIFNYRLQQ